MFVSFNEEFLSAIPVAKASVLHTGETKSGRKMLSLSSAHSAVGRDAATQDDLQGNPGMVGRTERTGVSFIGEAGGVEGAQACGDTGNGGHMVGVRSRMQGSWVTEVLWVSLESEKPQSLEQCLGFSLSAGSGSSKGNTSGSMGGPGRQWVL